MIESKAQRFIRITESVYPQDIYFSGGYMPESDSEEDGLKKSAFYEETSLDQVLSQPPELPRRDYHFDFSSVLTHAHDFNIVMDKVDEFSTMKHCLDPFVYVVAKLNNKYYIEKSKVKVEDSELLVSNADIEAGFDGDGFLTQVYTNKTKVKSDNNANLEDIYIKGCSNQLYNILQLTFKG